MNKGPTAQGLTIFVATIACSGQDPYDLNAQGDGTRRLSISIIGIMALAAPAHADWAVVRNPDGYCDIIWVQPVPTPAPRWPPHWTIIAITANWWSAVVEREWAWTVGDCKPLY